MLRIFDQAGKTNGRGIRRRDFLHVGGLALGGLSSIDLMSARAAADSLRLAHPDRSVIFLFLHGGPSQTETFDPKMESPAGIRSATGSIRTVTPGLHFGSTFPKLAARADRFSLVRSFQTGDGRHDIKPVVSRATDDANIGSLYSRIAGANHPSTGMPMNVALFPRSVRSDAQPENNNFGRFVSSGTLGGGFAPFVPGTGGPAQEDMLLSLPRRRLGDRRQLLENLDRLKHARENRPAEMEDPLRAQAFEAILSNVAAAFNLAGEDASVIQRYDTEPLVRAENISRKWNNYNNYVDNARTLGKLLLLARRLCEAGTGFVTVTTNFVWDMHADQNNAGVEEGMQYMGLPLDHALSAFIDDIEARGLQDKIMLVACGEMGRTPKINARGGRDHWGGLAPLLVYGGGLKMGQVIGQSNRDASQQVSRLESRILSRQYFTNC